MNMYHRNGCKRQTQSRKKFTGKKVKDELN